MKRMMLVLNGLLPPHSSKYRRPEEGMLKQVSACVRSGCVRGGCVRGACVRSACVRGGGMSL